MKSSTRWLIVVILFGVFVSALPHFYLWIKIGHPFWISDFDELELYWTLACNAYWNHPLSFSDPLFSEKMAATYPVIQIFHGTWIAKIFDFGPESIPFLWRVIAGGAIGACWFFVFSLFVSPSVAAITAIVFLGDSGLVHGKLFLTQFINLGHVLKGGDPHFIHSEWRLITPALSWPFLLFYVYSLKRALDFQSTKRIAIAGIALGLVVWSYFYFWTMAFAALALAFLVDRRRARSYLRIGIVGAIVGAPSIIKDMLLKHNLSQDWLQRTDKFVPIGHFEELLIPKLILIVIVFGGYWVWKYRADLRWLWCLVVAGLSLMNHQIVTGLQIENFHWYYGIGPMMWLFVTLVYFESVHQRRRELRTGIALLVVLQIGAGIWLRLQEVERSSVSVRIMDTARKIKSELTPLAANAVAAADPLSVSVLSCLANVRPLYSASVILSPNVKHQEFFERLALNHWLLGESLEEFTKTIGEFVGRDVWGPWYRDEQKRTAFQNSMAEAFILVQKEPLNYLNKYHVRYLLAPNPPGEIQGWKEIPFVEGMRLWERE